MIRITFFRRESGLAGFESEGHAGYAESGSDIVCAAVSAVLISAANGLQSVVGIVPIIRQNDEIGYLKAMLPDNLDDAQSHDANVVLAVAEHGLQSIAEQYPEYIRVISRNRR